MPRLSKKFKAEWEFFINPKTGFVTYNKKCKNCQNECKQSFRVDVVFCATYKKKLHSKGIEIHA